MFSSEEKYRKKKFRQQNELLRREIKRLVNCVIQQTKVKRRDFRKTREFSCEKIQIFFFKKENPQLHNKTTTTTKQKTQ